MNEHCLHKWFDNFWTVEQKLISGQDTVFSSVFIKYWKKISFERIKKSNAVIIHHHTINCINTWIADYFIFVNRLDIVLYYIIVLQLFIFLISNDIGIFASVTLSCYCVLSVEMSGDIFPSRGECHTGHFWYTY